MTNTERRDYLAIMLNDPDSFVALRRELDDLKGSAAVKYILEILNGDDSQKTTVEDLWTLKYKVGMIKNLLSNS